MKLLWVIVDTIGDLFFPVKQCQATLSDSISVYYFFSLLERPLNYANTIILVALPKWLPNLFNRKHLLWEHSNGQKRLAFSVWFLFIFIRQRIPKITKISIYLPKFVGKFQLYEVYWHCSMVKQSHWPDLCVQFMPQFPKPYFRPWFVLVLYVTHRMNDWNV